MFESIEMIRLDLNLSNGRYGSRCCFGFIAFRSTLNSHLDNEIS